MIESHQTWFDGVCILAQNPIIDLFAGAIIALSMRAFVSGFLDWISKR